MDSELLFTYLIQVPPVVVIMFLIEKEENVFDPGSNPRSLCLISSY